MTSHLLFNIKYTRLFFQKNKGKAYYFAAINASSPNRNFFAKKFRSGILVIAHRLLTFNLKRRDKKRKGEEEGAGKIYAALSSRFINQVH
jgi:hypothetical protein